MAEIIRLLKNLKKKKERLAVYEEEFEINFEDKMSVRARAFRLQLYFWSQSFQTLSSLSGIRAWSFLAQFLLFKPELEPKYLRAKEAIFALRDHST